MLAEIIFEYFEFSCHRDSSICQQETSEFIMCISSNQSDKSWLILDMQHVKSWLSLEMQQDESSNVSRKEQTLIGMHIYVRDYGTCSDSKV